MSEQWIIAIVTNAIVVLGALWGFSIRATNKAADVKAEIIKAITSHAKEDEEEFGKVRGEMNRAVIDFGETISALKQKLADVQLDAAEKYVRREGFWKAMENLTQTVTSWRNEIRADILRLEQKIDGRVTPEP